MSALELMAANDVNQLPVIDGFDFSGFVTRADVIRRIQVKAELAGLRRARSSSTSPANPMSFSRHAVAPARS